MPLVGPRKIADLLPAETSSKLNSLKGYTVGDNMIMISRPARGA